MTTLDLKLDMSRVQSSVQATIRPAVEEALKGVDLKQYIAAALTKKKPKDSRYEHMMMLGYGGPPTFDTLLDQFIHEGISEIASLYVKTAIANQRQEIEAALAKSMRGSTERMTKMFVKTALDAVDGWEFKFNGTVALPEADDDDD
jgi:hypothetical protein